MYYPLELFFGDEREVTSKHTEPRSKDQTQQAKRVCITCPVMAECLVWSMQRGYQWGVFGMMTEHERKRLKERFSAYREQEEGQEADEVAA